MVLDTLIFLSAQSKDNVVNCFRLAVILCMKIRALKNIKQRVTQGENHENK